VLAKQPDLIVHRFAQGRPEQLIIHKLTELDVEGFAGSATVSGARSQESARLLSAFGLYAPFLNAQNLHRGMEKFGTLFSCVRGHEFSPMIHRG
jgi:hypothetical protein